MFFSEQGATKKAVAYYRHSAEDKQENSVPIQREHAQKFAEQYNIEIIHEEADEGKSGLLSTRPGFERLFNEWILNAEAPSFEYVLVYDVSRWGRFQDQDEAAYFEFRCKQHGKKVIYVSRGFPKEEQQLISHLQTSIERYMAAEYSRQLSDKVFYGCVKVSEQGYSAGGTSCYGMARLLLDANKQAIRTLKKGEHKQIANERVTFVPLEDETSQSVQEMFDMLVNRWHRPESIAEYLNAKGIPSANGGLWSREKVLRILTNETYTGTRIYNKTWGRLKQTKRHNPRSEWVITPNAFPALVEPEVFHQAQEHLYWLIPSKWKKGVYTINKVKRIIEADIIALLANAMTEDEASLLLRRFPVTYSVCFYRESVPHWCFVIPEHMRNYDTVLGVSIILDQREPLDQVFAIPVKDFTEGNFIVFSQQDEIYQRVVVTRPDIEQKTKTVIRELGVVV